MKLRTIISIALASLVLFTVAPFAQAEGLTLSSWARKQLLATVGLT